MSTRKASLQAAAVITLGLSQLVGAHPAAAATALLCTQYCANYCDANICAPCYTYDCLNLQCTDIDGNTWPFDVGCI